MDPEDTHMGSPVGHERAKPRSGARLIGELKMAGVPGPGLGTPLKPFYRESLALAGAETLML